MGIPLSSGEAPTGESRPRRLLRRAAHPPPSTSAASRASPRRRLRARHRSAQMPNTQGCGAGRPRTPPGRSAPRGSPESRAFGCAQSAIRRTDRQAPAHPLKRKGRVRPDQRRTGDGGQETLSRVHRLSCVRLCLRGGDTRPPHTPQYSEPRRSTRKWMTISASTPSTVFARSSGSRPVSRSP